MQRRRSFEQEKRGQVGILSSPSVLAFGFDIVSRKNAVSPIHGDDERRYHRIKAVAKDFIGANQSILSPIDLAFTLAGHHGDGGGGQFNLGAGGNRRPSPFMWPLPSKKERRRENRTISPRTPKRVYFIGRCCARSQCVVTGPNLLLILRFLVK